MSTAVGSRERKRGEVESENERGRVEERLSDNADVRKGMGETGDRSVKGTNKILLIRLRVLSFQLFIVLFTWGHQIAMNHGE